MTFGSNPINKVVKELPFGFFCDFSNLNDGFKVRLKIGSRLQHVHSNQQLIDPTNQKV